MGRYWLTDALGIYLPEVHLTKAGENPRHLEERTEICGSSFRACWRHLQGLRVSLKHYGIAVTTICPGFVKSELTDHVRYKMPFLWETDRAARKIADAIEQRRGEVVFPWQMKFAAVMATRLMPTPWIERIMTRVDPR